MSQLFHHTLEHISSDADINELESKSTNISPQFTSTYQLFSEISKENPSAPALTFLPSGALDIEPVRLNRSELLGHINQTANMFRELGVGPTDVVSFLLPNLLEAQFTLWGAQAAGIANPINFLLGTEQIIEICNAAKTKVLVTLGPHPALDIWQKVEALQGKVSTLEKIVVVGGIPESATDTISYHQTIQQFPKDKLMFERTIKESDIATLFHTGGTTGTPKLAPHSHGNEIAAAQATAQMYGFCDQDVLVNGLPLFHVAAPILLTLAPLGAGAEVLIPSPAGLRDPAILENHWKITEKYNVTIIGGVPTSISDLTRIPIRDANISKIKFAIVGGAPLTAGIANRFKSHTNLTLHQVYGMTETCGAIAITPQHCSPVEGSVGMRLPGVKIKAVQLNMDGTWLADCPIGETGTLAVQGKNVFPGYSEAKNNSQTFFNGDWLNTGDVGHVDENGFIYITGRSKDVIIRSGHNIDPVSIEEVAENHPAVETCVAVGQPDARAGEVPVVFVKLMSGKTVDAEEIRAYIKDNISERPAKAEAVYIIEQIPLTSVGKIYRPKLRCEAVKYLVESKLQTLDFLEQTPEISIDDSDGGKIVATVNLAAADKNNQAAITAITACLSDFAFAHLIQ